MVLLDRISNMRKQGMSEADIIRALQQEGISPKEIHETLSQSKIKTAINAEQADMSSGNQFNQPVPEPLSPETAGDAPESPIGPPTAPMTNTPPQQAKNPETRTPEKVTVSKEPGVSKGQMMPSIMPSGEQTRSDFGNRQKAPPEFSRIPKDTGRPREIPGSYQSLTTPTQPPQEYYPEEGGYDYQVPDAGQDYGYEDYPEYQYGQASDVETINDIASQIVEEKNAELQMQISKFSKFRREMALEVERISERLKKVEGAFNDLQIAIISKMGDYGKDVKSIAKEMRASQDSFSKILDPLAENIKELRRLTSDKSKK
jgi:DNA-binding transcriptional MerR regulator